MKPEKAIYCVLHQQDEFPHFQHHHGLFGFPFSQYTCPRETQLVVSLFKASLLRPYSNVLQPSVAAIEPEVSILYYAAKPSMKIYTVPLFLQVR